MRCSCPAIACICRCLISRIARSNRGRITGRSYRKGRCLRPALLRCLSHQICHLDCRGRSRAATEGYYGFSLCESSAGEGRDSRFYCPAAHRRLSAATAIGLLWSVSLKHSPTSTPRQKHRHSAVTGGAIINNGRSISIRSAVLYFSHSAATTARSSAGARVRCLPGVPPFCAGSITSTPWCRRAQPTAVRYYARFSRISVCAGPDLTGLRYRPPPAIAFVQPYQMSNGEIGLAAIAAPYGLRSQMRH